MEAKYAGPVATGLDTSQKREKPQATCWYNFNGDFIINVCKEEGRAGGVIWSDLWWGEREQLIRTPIIMGTSPGATDNLSVMKVKI